jgi:predicted permease
MLLKMMLLAFQIRRVCLKLVRHPGSTIALVALTAVGLSVAISVSRLYMTILRPTPFHEPQRLYSVISAPRNGGDAQRGLSPADYRLLEEIGPSLGVISGYLLFSRPLRIDDEVLVVSGAAVSASFFKVLQIPALLGRTFTVAEDHPGAEPVAVISETVWRRLFHSSPQALQRAFYLGDRSYRLVGIVPDKLAFPHSVGIWIPLNPEAGPLWRIRNVPIMGALIRVNETASSSSVAVNLARLSSVTWADLKPVSLNAYLTDRVKGPAVILLGAGLLLLCLCAASISGFLTAAALRRRRDLAIEQSLGLSPSMLFTQFLAEGLAIGICAWLLGRMMAGIYSTRLASFVPSANFDVSMTSSEGTITLAGLCFVLLIAGISAMATFVDVRRNVGLSGEITTVTKRTRRTVWSGLVAFQVAASVTFLSLASVLLLDYFRLTQHALGFSPANVATFELRFSSVNASPNTWSSEIQEIATSLRERLGGVRVGLSSALPGSGQINLAEVRLNATDAAKQADLRVVGGEFFDVVGVRLVRGREFERTDTSLTTPVALIDETAANAWFGAQDVIGRRMMIGMAQQVVTVVGVVSPTRQDVHADPYPTVYLSQMQFPWQQVWFVLKGDSDRNVDRLLREGPKLARSVNRSIVVENVTTLEAVVDAMFLHRRARLMVVGLFGGIAVLIAVMGVYTLVSAKILDHRVEVGIRLALGATDNNVLRLLLARVGLVVVIGALSGTAATTALGVTVASLIPEFPGVNGWCLLASVGLIFSAALPAVFVPVHRLVRRGPAVLLREI